MQLLPECSLVASGYLGFGLSSPWDSHVYLLRSGTQALLIDSGSGREPEALAAAIERELAGAATLVGVALTHAHVDHSGGASDLAQRFGVPVYANPIAAAWLADADEEAIGLPAARAAGVYPPDQRLLAVVGALDVDRIPVGDLVVEVHRTPGHSPDHQAYAVRLPSGLALFTGDLVFAQGRIALQEQGSDVELYERSIREMVALDPEHLFPGHGAVAITAGRAHLRAAVDAYDRGLTPAGLVV